MLNLLRVVVLLSVCNLLTGCPSTSVRAPSDGTGALPTIGTPDLRGATIYTVNSAVSDLQVQVFRGGTLARLGHNHVMTSKQVSGRVWLQSAIVRSGFDLEFPVASLVVDDAQAREAAGNEFSGTIAQADREDTRKNMLRAEVLDAENYPTIKLQSVRLAGSLNAAQIMTRITIKGVTRDVFVPVTISSSGNELTASGSFDILQTHFGIKPFSIGLGALEVQDRLRIVFKIAAQR
jgi:polyisoprenoid-binding protein YceI